MSRIDIARLRKRAGMSQRELAEELQVRPSFLSAIENGKSRMPEEKMERLKEIFELDSLEEFMIEDQLSSGATPHTHLGDQGDYLTQLLNHFHDLAHQRDRNNANFEELYSRIDFLGKRNDRLSERVDNLREEVDRLREENLRLKELLVRNGIHY
ncbi:MAG: helix-turn-helix domain-containing protein [Muribaculaceae bacterium]|nr:helix-turn-helix domain-containing protein [Muribaculaceae bacterium]MDE7109177.1 helix-turn-helix domain-containing protein [Muribaculaceae bacterium]